MSGKKTGGGDILFSHGSSAARGACILFSRKLHWIINSTTIDTEGRYVIADIEIKGIRLIMTNMYAPNDDNPTFFLNLSQKIEDFSNENQIIGGDFNLVLNINMDKRHGRQTTNFKSQEVLRNWCEQTDLIDIWRLQHPEDQTFTWYRKKTLKSSAVWTFFWFHLR